ncbi:collagen alpha-1(IX) chain-like [Penaeus indicus]|uniref:collagen alpha-1(IX) chain-like n=1 Tax=Penaeus indicus TaxID=29960 RepID=UPI00300CD79C
MVVSWKRWSRGFRRLCVRDESQKDATTTSATNVWTLRTDNFSKDQEEEDDKHEQPLKNEMTGQSVPAKVGSPFEANLRRFEGEALFAPSSRRGQREHETRPHKKPFEASALTQEPTPWRSSCRPSTEASPWRPRGQVRITPHLTPFPALPPPGKKAPSGFLGMRGKKSDEVFAGNEVDSELESLLKRAPSGFLGMRGKKAPSGFLGMRGKKAPSGFLGMRGKKMYEDDEAEVDAYIQALAALVEQQQKRAPSGFLGMRGKKADYDEDFEEDMGIPGLDKRAPSGFIGMRG